MGQILNFAQCNLTQRTAVYVSMLPVSQSDMIRPVEKPNCTVNVSCTFHAFHDYYKNSSVDEIANVNFYAVRPEDTRIR